ncbi:hypothetical protein IC762_12775 [Bradyrhizobium genosp. L]|uniref:hypothetical protein n=1 Tax=Bradyrhizobium genosp. L TaxID=83637 RepID=UPI0018A2BD4B|nr:hypothetical protein [Bradyrhizobium genosp. L]QPF87111.1 hypothetical protein IC762_12775 [Bradyrhizobium genosp. L]
MVPLFALGLASVIWSCSALPLFVLALPARDIAGRIVADERFRAGTLAEMVSNARLEQKVAILQPELASARALMQLRVAEEAMQRESSDVTSRKMDEAYEDVRTALTVAPTNSFLWLLLYSVQMVRTGLESSVVVYLGHSYTTGPLEGWIALRRNRLALSAFPFLNPVTQRLAISEFAEMVDADLTDESATNLSGVGWLYRDRLLAGLEGVDMASREKLAKRLARDGIKVRVPGVEQDDRPW